MGGDYRKTGIRGKYSGSLRLDITKFEEHETDDAENRKKWLTHSINDLAFEKEMEDMLLKWSTQIKLTADPTQFIFHMVGQSHIDMAWLWRYEQTRKKVIVTLSKAVRNATEYPDRYRFAMSSPQLLAWINEDAPELFQEIKDKVKSGQIELVGGSWVEPDCMMPSGEAMIRQRLYGMRFYRDEFQQLPEVEWFLDSFGYNIGLPQILKKSGARYFWTSKLTWNKQTHFPFVNFFWQSPDGSQLLTANFGQFKEMFTGWTENSVGRHPLRADGKKMWNYGDDYTRLTDHLDHSIIIPPVGYFAGKGDGGHGPDSKDLAEMLMMPSIAAKMNPPMTFQWSKVQTFFQEIEKFQETLPIWCDELYLETHRGTFTVHNEVKRYNRKFEYQIQATEHLATLLSIYDPSYAYPFDELERTWKSILLNQFHDVLPGSSVIEVYDDVFHLWQEIDKTLEQLLSEGVSRMRSTKDENIILFNPLSWARTTRVFIPTSIMEPKPPLDESGKPPHAQLTISEKTSRKTCFCQPTAAEFQDNMPNNPAGWWTIVNIPAFGILHGKLSLGGNSPQKRMVKGALGKQPGLSNNLIRLQMNPSTGGVYELTVKGIANHKNLLYGDTNLLIQGYKDRGYDGYPAWNLSKKYWKRPKNYAQNQNVSISLDDAGPIFCTLKITRILGISSVVQKITLFQDDPMLYCFFGADWQEQKTMLKMGLQTTTKAQKVTVDEMFCTLSQSTLPESPCDKARFEKIMHTFADMSTPRKDWGITLINEGKYAFDASGGRLRLTLHRAVEYPTPSKESWINIERQVRKDEEGTAPPKFSDIGPISCRFGFLPHKGGVEEVKRRAEEFNSPLIVQRISKHRLDGVSIPALDFSLPSNVLLSCIKREEWMHPRSQDVEIVFRFTEISRKATTVNLLLPAPLGEKIAGVREVDFLERSVIEDPPHFTWNDNKFSLQFPIKSNEVKTFAFILKPKA